MNLTLPPELLAKGSSSLLPVGIDEPQPLTPEHLSALALRSPDSGPLAPLKSIRETHHMLARMIAEGRPDGTISAVLGYSPPRIKILRDDPGIQELVAHYKSLDAAVQADVHTQIHSLALTAMQELHSRLEENPEDFSTPELLKIAETGLDRTGHGAQTKLKVTTVDAAAVIREIKALPTGPSRVISREDIEDVSPPTVQRIAGSTT